jgi:hypothetical protein
MEPLVNTKDQAGFTWAQAPKFAWCVYLRFIDIMTMNFRNIGNANIAR